MVSFIDDAFVFFNNVIGQIILIIGGLVTALKYLDSKQNKRIEDEIAKQLRETFQPIQKEINDDLQEMRISFQHLQSSLQTQKELNEQSIEFLEKLIGKRNARETDH